MTRLDPSHLSYKLTETTGRPVKISFVLFLPDINVVPAFPALPHPTPPIKLATLDYMFSRLATQPPLVIDRLVEIHAAKAAVESG